MRVMLSYMSNGERRLAGSHHSEEHAELEGMSIKTVCL